MKNLKVGDIKKFIIKDRELVGIIVTKYSNSLEIACLDGDIREIDYIKQMQENNNFRYTAVRLDPKLRNRFELIAEELKKYYMIEKNIHSLEKKIEEMKKERNKQWGNVKNNINELPKIQGYIKPSDLLTVFNEKLKKVN